MPLIESILIVCHFVDIFPADRMTLDRDIYFSIDFDHKTLPISIPLYRMAPADLRELRAKLQEFFGKGFISPSASSWGAPVFICEEDG